MAANKKGKSVNTSATKAKPVFPYTTRPASLRKFLQEVPKRPRPPKVNRELLAGWGLPGGENITILRVVKTLGFLNAANEPTELYAGFMASDTGPAVLAQQIRAVYAPLFTAAHQPQREAPEKLRNLFNIHSAGAPATIEFQIQTFKALCDNADFARESSPATAAGGPETAAMASLESSPETLPQIRVDLHIHLPPDRSSRDYEYIIQDIAKYIFGRSNERRGE